MPPLLMVALSDGPGGPPLGVQFEATVQSPEPTFHEYEIACATPGPRRIELMTTARRGRAYGRRAALEQPKDVPA